MKNVAKKPPLSARARSWGRAKSLNLGKLCYKTAPTKLLYNSTSFVVGQGIGLPFIENYRYGEIRQTIVREMEGHSLGVKVLPWDLEQLPTLSQNKLTPEMKDNFALKLLKKHAAGPHKYPLMMTFLASMAIMAGGMCISQDYLPEDMSLLWKVPLAALAIFTPSLIATGRFGLQTANNYRALAVGHFRRTRTFKSLPSQFYKLKSPNGKMTKWVLHELARIAAESKVD